MKRLWLLFIIATMIFGGFDGNFTTADGVNADGKFRTGINIYDSPTGGRLIHRIPLGTVEIDNGRLTDWILPPELSGFDEIWIELEGLSSERIKYSSGDSGALLRETPTDPDEISEEMATHLQIGRVGETDDLVVHSPRTGFGVDTPSERIDVEGAIAIREGSSPTTTTDVGKVYVNDADGHLYFIDEAGNITDLTVDANAVQSISSSANPTGRTEHMRMIPGEGAEITESATDDTIYIHYSLGGTAPCSGPPSAPSTLVGPSSVCEMATGVSFSVPPVSGASYYFWDLPTEAYIAAGSGSNSVIIDFGSTPGDITVHSYNECGTSASGVSSAITINNAPSMPGSITGAATVCASATEGYSISPVSGATSYSWSLPTGAFIASGYGTNSITVTFASTSGTVCVTADNACGSSDPQCMPVTVFGSLSGLMPGAITGPSSVCAGETDVAYSISEISDATSYSWSVPSSASIVSGTGTNSILVDFGTTSGNVSVSGSNLCGTSDTRTLAVSVSPNSVGGSISGASSICLGSATGDMTLSGNVGTVTKWQKSRDGGGWVDISRTEITYSETPSLAGTWEYRAEVRSGACDAVFSSSHTVTVAPVTVGGTVSGGSTPICEGSSTGSMSLSGHTGSVVRWQRQFDGGSWTDIAHTATTYSETPSTPGTWQYRAVVQSSPCSQEFSVPVAIVVNPTTVAGAVSGGTSPICDGEDPGVMTLSGHTGTVVKWQKQVDGGSWVDISHTSATYSETPSSAGTWQYRAVVQSGVCSQLNSSPRTIVVNPIPVSTFGPEIAVTGFPQTFTPDITADSYSWTFESGSPSTSTAANPAVTWSIAGSYDVTLETTVDGCSHSTTVTVVVTDPPTCCLDILNSDPLATDGVYTIYPSTGIIDVYCDMTTDDGGWTLVFRDNHDGINTDVATGTLGNPVNLQSVTGPTAKYTDATINAIKSHSTSAIGFRTTSPDISQRYYHPGSCNYSHNSSNPSDCMKIRTTWTTSPSPSYTQYTTWGGGGGGINCWYRSGYCNAVVTTRSTSYPEQAGITTNPSFGGMGSSNTAYGNTVLMWVR